MDFVMNAEESAESNARSNTTVTISIGKTKESTETDFFYGSIHASRLPCTEGKQDMGMTSIQQKSFQHVAHKEKRMIWETP
jgi:hypothetical protein